MKNKFFIATLAMLFFMLSGYAMKVTGFVKDKDNQPIIGANVWWDTTNKGTTTNEDGYFEIKKDNSGKKLMVSYIGYETVGVQVSKTSEPITVIMQDNVQLDEVVVSKRRTGLINSRLAPIQTQTITYDELCRAACCNLAESFVTNPSVDVSYSDAATGARQIKLLGLSGTYVQMLTEQTPNIRGAASLYGLGYVPGPWMESIQVSKGTSSVKNGYEALTGQINVEYKKPQKADPLSVNLFAADNGRMEANVDGNIVLNKELATGLLLHYSREMNEHDANKDGFLDLPKTEQFNAMNRWYYKADRYIAQAAVNIIHEKREGGTSMHSDINDMNPYNIDINTNRGSFFTKNGYIINKEKNTSMALIFSGSYHDQESLFGKTKYDVTQKNLYANLLFETEFTKQHHFSSGVSINWDDFNERIAKSNINGLGNYPLNRNEKVFGAYAQYTYLIADKLSVLAGIRGDYHNDHGFFVTPRMHVKYAPISELTLRASAGKGYRVANLLVENSFLFASSRKFNIANGIDPFESAWNYGASASLLLPIVDKGLSVNLEYYHTEFDKQLVADMDYRTDQVSFYNLDGRSYARNIQIEASYPFFRGFTLTAAYRMTDAKSTYNGVLREKPLTSRYKALATTSYQTPLKKWQFDLTTQLNGPGRMPDPDLVNPLWEKTFESYVNLNAQITKNFRTWSIYVGGENMTGFKQKNPIINASNPWGAGFDASMVWGPMHGAKYYVGIRWSIPKI